jgi:predicted regulator of Ras-like GTPase activity (Roadblock/LC7/MglB family)
VFTEHLKKVCDNVEGGVAALIMGLDGIAVESYVREAENVDINTIGMEFSFILTQIKKAGDILQLGGVQEISIKAEQLLIVIRMINDEYFVAAALRSDGNFGKCRFLLRMATARLADEF